MRRKLLFFIFITTLTTCAPSAKMKRYDSYRFVQQNTDSLGAGQIRITFLGTSTLLIDDGETQLLTDGFVTRPGLLKTGFGKVSCDTAKVLGFVSAYDVSRLKAVFCAHSHYDHAMDAPFVAQQTGAVLYGSPSTLNIGRGAGLDEGQMQLYRVNEPLKFGKFTVVIMPSKHTPPFKLMGKTNDDLGVEIAQPLHQPAKASAYSEGGAFDMLIEHSGKRILIKASTNWLPGALDSIKADVVFLGIASLGKQDSSFRETYYNETVGKLRPSIVVPIHWDNFFKPLSPQLKALPKAVDNVKLGIDYLIGRCKQDGIDLRLMQGGDVVLF